MPQTLLSIFLILFSVLFITPLAQAQKLKGGGRKEAKAKVEKNTEDLASEADALFADYCFEQAAELYAKEIAAARRRSVPTLRLEESLQRARLGENMLRATERVAFLDSTVVSRADLFERLRLSEECGRIVPTDKSRIPLPASRRPGKTTYINELDESAIFALSDSAETRRLYRADRIGRDWTITSQALDIPTDNLVQDYPYMMADGVTLYFAAQGPESLGGYDIFVTRYNAATGRFVKPENIGMPFNSPANDYLYAIDETTGVGFFVTDRGQSPDSVCIYRFLPAEVRRLYGAETDEETLRHYAMLRPFADSRVDSRTLSEAMQRISRADAANAENSEVSLRFVINDNTVYTDLSRFRSDAARRIAKSIIEQRMAFKATQQSLDLARRGYRAAPSPALAAQIAELERKETAARAAIHTMEKNMRKAELGR